MTGTRLPREESLSVRPREPHASRPDALHRGARAWFAVALLLVAVGALAFRLPHLTRRPMHGDEAVHAAKFRQLWQQGTYTYDPNEFHGPTLYYAALPVVWLSGARTFAETDEATFRRVTVLFGVGLILLLWLLADGLGRPATLGAAVLTALSPAFVFYSRYYIQETLLVFFTLLALAGAWRYRRSGRVGWAVAAGAGLGLMHATKETCVLSWGAMALGLWATRRYTARVEGKAPTVPLPRRHLAAALATGLFLSILFLSGCFTHARGPLDSLLSYFPWLGRAGSGSLHVHPWHYYLGLILYSQRAGGPVWSEALILGLALVGMAAGLRRWERDVLPDASLALVRFLTFYTLALTTVYALVPYKTPWCLLGFHHGFVLLAGVGAVALLRGLPGVPLKALVGLALLAALWQLGTQAYRANYLYEADPRNPYVYAHPVPDVVDLAEKVAEIARAHPDRERLVVKVFAENHYYWPLPWYLRRFEHVGYWRGVPDEEWAAPVILAAPRFDALLTERLGRSHQMTGFYGLRPEVSFQLWVERSLWQEYLKLPRPVRQPAEW